MSGSADAARRAAAARFSGRARRLRAAALFLAAGTVLFAIGLAVAISSGDAEPSRGPGPLVAALAGTDWRLPTDPATGYRRLSTPFRGARFDRVAASRSGVLAWAARLADRPWVVAWRDRAVRSVPFDGSAPITALAVDPDGVVHVGFSDGSLARIRADGVLEHEPPVAPGNSVVGFAFDPTSRDGALMLSGGEVRVGARPLRATHLRTLRMPEGAAVGLMAYDEDGDLVVAGDDGAVFVRSGRRWDERRLPTAGDVTALGSGGRLLATESNGNVFEASGGSWDLVGRVDGRALAVGRAPDHGVVVGTANGRIYGPSDDGDLTVVEGFSVPGDFRASSAAVAGANVLFAGQDRLLAWDGERFDATDHDAPDGVVTREGCEPIVPPVGVDPPSPIFDCGGGAHDVLAGGALEIVEALSLGGANVSAGDYERALHEAHRREAVWVAGAMYAPSEIGFPPSVTRFAPSTGRWDPFASIDPEAGDLLSLSGAEPGVLWAVTRSGTVFRAVLADDPPTFVPVVTHTDFQASYGPDFVPSTVRVDAIDARHAVLTHDGWISTRVCVPEETDPCAPAEPLALFDVPVGARIQRVAGAVLFVEPGRVRAVGASGPPSDYELPAGVDPSLRGGGHDVAVRGADVALLARDSLLRCHEGRCETVPVPPWVHVEAILFASDGALLVREPDGLLGVAASP